MKDSKPENVMKAYEEAYRRIYKFLTTCWDTCPPAVQHLFKILVWVAIIAAWLYLSIRDHNWPTYFVSIFFIPLGLFYIVTEVKSWIHT